MSFSKYAFNQTYRIGFSLFLRLLSLKQYRNDDANGATIKGIFVFLHNMGCNY